MPSKNRHRKGPVLSYCKSREASSRKMSLIWSAVQAGGLGCQASWSVWFGEVPKLSFRSGRSINKRNEGRHSRVIYRVGRSPGKEVELRCRVAPLTTTPSQEVSVFFSAVANFDPGTFSLMRCDFCGAGFDTRAGLSSHARAHLRDFGITNWELTISPINILQELLATSAAELPPSPLDHEPSVPPGSFLTSRRPRLPLTMPFPPTWAEDPGPIYGDGKGRVQARPEPLSFPRSSEGWMGELEGVHSVFLEAFHLSVILALRLRQENWGQPGLYSKF